MVLNTRPLDWKFSALTTRPLKYTLFYKQRFFSTLRQCCVAFSQIQLQMLLGCCLLNTYNRHHTEAHLAFSIFVSMSRPRSIYVVLLLSIFYFEPLFHCH